MIERDIYGDIIQATRVKDDSKVLTALMYTAMVVFGLLPALAILLATVLGITELAIRTFTN